MKINYENFRNHLSIIPIYPITIWNAVSVEKDDESKINQSVKMELKTVPTDPNSAKYSAWFKKFVTRSPEEWCQWCDDLLTILLSST